MNTTEWIKGKSIQQILDMPLNELESLTVPQLRTLVGRGVSAGNKRLRRFLARYKKIPYAGKGAERNADYEKVKFSAMGKDRTELMEEFKRIKSYLKAKTSSVTGYERVKRESRKALKERYGIVISKKDFDDFWEIYEKLKELKPELKERAFKYVVLDNIKIAMKEKRKELTSRQINAGSAYLNISGRYVLAMSRKRFTGGVTDGNNFTLEGVGLSEKGLGLCRES